MRRFPSVVVLMMLAACTTPPDGAVRQQSETPPPAAKRPAAASLPQPAPAPRASAKGAERIDPKRLVGLSRDQVAALIGKPASISDTPPATVWEYRTDGCSLEVMFYMDLGTQTFRALAYEIHVTDPAGPPEPECLGRIRAARHAR